MNLICPDPMRDDAYYGLIGEMVATIEPHTESDPAAILIQSLVAFGNIIGKSSYFTVEGANHHTNLFSCLVGNSAKSRKGTSWSNVKRVFQEVDSSWAKTRIQSGLSTGEGMLTAIGEIGDRRLLLVESEFASPLKVATRDGNTLTAKIRDAWDTGDLSILTRGNPLNVRDAHISIIGHITVDELRRYMTQTEQANGFANRFLWVCVERSQLLPDGGNLTDEALQPYITRLKKAVDFASHAGHISRDKAARELWHAEYKRLTSSTDLGLAAHITSRADAQTVRLSLIYALLDQSKFITEKHLRAALEIWRYSEESAYAIFGSTTGDPYAERIIKSLETAGAAGVTQAYLIQKVFNGNVPASVIHTSLENLSVSGTIRKEIKKTEKRDCVTWFLNI